MKKHCLLISPHISAGLFFPRGIVEIASFLKSNGCSVGVVPLIHYLENTHSGNPRSIKKKQVTSILEKIIKEHSPQVIGVSNQYTQNYYGCLEILQTCKRINKNIITVIGGPHVTFLDTECIKSPFIDVIVRGEGEWTMLDLLSTLKKRKSLESVKGITYKQYGKVIRTPERPLGDLRKIPPIDFGLLPAKYVRRSIVMGILNRGCWYNCAFCAERVFWRKVRSFNVRRLINEIKILKDRYKNEMYGINGSMTSLSSDDFFELCSELRKQRVKIKPSFSIMTRIDTVTDESIEALKKVNMCLSVGIESGSPKVLRMMRKNVTTRQVVKISKKLRENKIKVSTAWMYGHPGESPQEAARSYDFLKYLFTKDLIRYASVHVFMPLPGTPFFNQPEKYGIEILNHDWSKWAMSFSMPICQLKGFSAEQIFYFCQKSKKIVKGCLTLASIAKSKEENL